MNHAKTSFSTEIFACAIVNVCVSAKSNAQNQWRFYMIVKWRKKKQIGINHTREGNGHGCQPARRVQGEQ
jgi:hypothetical protein